MPPQAPATPHPQVCMCESAGGPEQWVFLPELGVRRRLGPLPWDPWGLDWGGSPLPRGGPPDAAAYGGNQGSRMNEGSRRGEWEGRVEGEGTRASTRPRPRYLRPLAGSQDGSEPRRAAGTETGSRTGGRALRGPYRSRLPALVSLCLSEATGFA